VIPPSPYRARGDHYRRVIPRWCDGKIGGDSALKDSELVSKEAHPNDRKLPKGSEVPFEGPKHCPIHRKRGREKEAFRCNKAHFNSQQRPDRGY